MALGEGAQIRFQPVVGRDPRAAGEKAGELVWLAISNARNSPCMFCKPPAHGLIRPSPFKGMSVTFVVLGPGGGNMGDELFPARPRSSLEVSVPEGVIEDLGLV